MRTCEWTDMANVIAAFHNFAFEIKMIVPVARCHGLVMHQKTEVICERHHDSCGYGPQITRTTSWCRLQAD
jgi:hypothetical protein